MKSKNKLTNEKVILLRSKTGLVLALLLIALGFGRITAWVLSSPSFDDVFFHSGLSPLPIAFSHFSGHEDFVMEGSLLFLDSSRKIQARIPLDAEHLKSIPGSWSKKAILLISSLYAPRFDQQEIKKVMETLGCGLFPNTYEIQLALKSRTKKDWNFERVYTCASTLD